MRLWKPDNLIIRWHWGKWRHFAGWWHPFACLRHRVAPPPVHTPVLLQTVFCGANLSAGLIPSPLGSDKFVEVRAPPGIWRAYVSLLEEKYKSTRAKCWFYLYFAIRLFVLFLILIERQRRQYASLNLKIQIFLVTGSLRWFTPYRIWNVVTIHLNISTVT